MVRLYMSSADKEYNKIGSEYSNIIGTDPSKQFVQYFFILTEIGKVSQKRVLDVGCGDGILSKKIAEAGAEVIGYDTSEVLIDTAQRTNFNKRIKYMVATPQTFQSNVQFDVAISNLVLPCAIDYEDLKAFFTSTFKYLKSDCCFISTTLNPDFNKFGEVTYNRRFNILDKNRIQIEFFDHEGAVKFSIIDNVFSREQYERAAFEAGFKKVEWKKMSISQEGKDTLPKQFWAGYEDNCPYIGFIVTKQ